ncbi:MAG: precorrin-2 dehydrogenase [Clostridiales bacterium]|nr:precorrin-2 dehydrogenase [Clostridiales bacterium]
MARYYPVILDLEHCPCLVVGGGSIAQRKIEGMMQCGADITMIGPSCTPRLEAMAAEGSIHWLPCCYRAGMARGFAFVCAASDDAEVNEQVAIDCRRDNIPVNVVDNIEISSAIIPAVLRRADVIVSVSTSGCSPALAAAIRDKIADVIGPEYGIYNDMLGEIRKHILVEIDDPEKRRYILRNIVDQRYIDMIKAGYDVTPELILDEISFKLERKGRLIDREL